MLYLIHFYEYLWDWCVNFSECKAPRFIRKPRSTEVVEGDSLVIVCEVAGDPKPDVIWLRDWLNVSFKLNTFFMLTSYSTAALPANSNCFSKISFNYWVQWLVKGSKKKDYIYNLESFTILKMSEFGSFEKLLFNDSNLKFAKHENRFIDSSIPKWVAKC